MYRVRDRLESVDLRRKPTDSGGIKYSGLPVTHCIFQRMNQGRGGLEDLLDTGVPLWYNAVRKIVHTVPMTCQRLIVRETSSAFRGRGGNPSVCGLTVTPAVKPRTVRGPAWRTSLTWPSAPETATNRSGRVIGVHRSTAGGRESWL